MEMDDLHKLMAELMAAHRDTEHHVVRMIERRSDLEAMAGRIEKLTGQLTVHNMRLDARLKRLEERRRGGSLQ